MYLLPGNFNQKAFAVIPLLILTLFGIAAGTLLVQNGVNFLPKAQQQPNDTECQIAHEDPDYYYQPTPYIDAGCKKATTDAECNKVYKASTYGYSKNRAKCVSCIQEHNGNPNYYLDDDGNCEHASSDEACKKTGLGPDAWYDNSRGTCVTVYSDPVRSPGEYCDLDGQCAVGSSCKQFPYFPKKICTPDWKPANDGVIRIKTFCLPLLNGEGIWQIRKANGAVENDTTLICPKDPCTYTFNEICQNANKECKKDSATEAHCEDKSAPAQGAPAATPQKIQAKKCSNTCPSNSLGCYEIDNKIRCVFEPAVQIKCTEGPKSETEWCQSEPDRREGCETADAILVENNTEKPIQYTRCTPAKAGAPALAAAPGTAPRSNAGTPTAPGRSLPAAAPGAPTTTQPAAPLNCGKDKDGLDIPCYSIGVFSKEELTSREAQAKIASVNYESFRKILKEQEEQIGKTIAENAERKIKEAEAAMKACMQ